MRAPSLLTGDNAAFLDVFYRRWLDDPGSVDAEWRAVFEGWDRPVAVHTPPAPDRRSIFGGRAAAGADPEAVLQAAHRQAKVAQLINAYRVRGHVAADIDPLDRRDRTDHPELTLGYWGLSDSDLDARVSTAPLFGLPPVAPLRDVVERCRAAYCTTIGAEFMNVNEVEQKKWIQQRLETMPDRRVIDHDQELFILRKLADAENFERLLHTRFPGTKRFSLEGAETLVPLLDLVVEHAGDSGVKEIVFGMAHRGRLNTLVNVLDKPVKVIVREFEDTSPESFQGSGDVKYHLGYSSDHRTQKGSVVHLSLTPNPSHLEAVNPVVEGRVRAKQDRRGDVDHRLVMAVLLHGDAAFAGQGLVPETLNLSELPGYRTGGTIHVIVNNQIGFTASPLETRSTAYATDIARMLAIPIFHVNGEDPRAVAAVTQMAVEWRQTFARDVVLDMYCYRKHGHNEGDEPSFTQPLMYETIRSRPTPREVFARRLVDSGHLTVDEVDRVVGRSRDDMERSLGEGVAAEWTAEEARNLDVKGVGADADLYVKKTAGNTANKGIGKEESPFKGLWGQYDGSIDDEVDTGVELDRLRHLIRRLSAFPPKFKPHTKIRRLAQQRDACAAGTRPIDWGLAELAAYASLVTEGIRVRLSGQDSSRGTFSQRHAVFTDVRTGDEYCPLQHIAEDQSEFRVIDSPLSEAGVLGFEYGYSLDYPDALVLWEAQFGDFANGAQVIIDQFVAAGWQKWARRSGLVALLPHGYEGQGPEHSSARLERYLALCAQENLQVACCTTPANHFHLLRRQGLRSTRVPLFVMTPKSLLRHPAAASSIDELANGAFQRVIPDPDPPERARRIVMCAGKLYYELAAARAEAPFPDVAIHRIELLHPWPADVLAPLLAEHPEAEWVWAQEEPRNMGAWPVINDWFAQFHGRIPRYVGRPAAASPATGSHRKHKAEQSAVIDAALAQDRS